MNECMYFLASNIKNEVWTMISFGTFNIILAKTQKPIRNNFCNVFVQISDKYKNYLPHMVTPANVRNNYILALNLMRNITCR